MTSKTDPKTAGNGYGDAPGLAPYPGFTPCEDCGGLRVWEAHRQGRWVTPIGADHDCAAFRAHVVALGVRVTQDADGAWRWTWLEKKQDTQDDILC